LQFQFGDVAEHTVEIGRGTQNTITIIFRQDKTLEVESSGGVKLTEIQDPTEKPADLQGGDDFMVFGVVLDGDTGMVSVSEKGADGSGEEPRLEITFNAQELAPPKETKEDKVKATKEKNNNMAKKICDQVQKMTDITVEDEAENKVNAGNKVILGAAVHIITDILTRNPKIDIVQYYGTENLIFKLQEGASSAPLRKALRNFYGLVYVAAGDTYPELVENEGKSEIAMIRRCCHDTYLNEMVKMTRADAAKKRADEKQAKKEAWLASLTPAERAAHDETEAKNKAEKEAKSNANAVVKRAEKKAEQQAAANMQKQKVEDGAAKFALLMSTDTKPFTLTDKSYKIVIKEDEMGTLHDFFKEAVSTPLSIEDIVNGFSHLIPDMKHKKTIGYFKDVLLNKCQTMSMKACKNPDAGPDDFFKHCLAFFLVRLVARGPNDTGHSAKDGVLRVPFVSDDDLAKFMEWEPHAMQKWGNDMKHSAFMLAQLEKTPLHGDMRAIFDNFSKYMVEPVMTGEIVQMWNENNKTFEAHVLTQGVLRSYQLQKAKENRVSGKAEILDTLGVFNKDTTDIQTLQTKATKAQKTLDAHQNRAENNMRLVDGERVMKESDENKLVDLKRKRDEAVQKHTDAAENLTKKRSMGIGFFVETMKVVPE